MEACRESGRSDIPAPEFLSRITDAETLRAIGKAYTGMFPDESDKDILADFLLKDFPASQKKGEESLLGYFHGQVDEDFVSGDVVVIAGWVLSRTEARQCALYSVTHK